MRRWCICDKRGQPQYSVQQNGFDRIMFELPVHNDHDTDVLKEIIQDMTAASEFGERH